MLVGAIYGIILFSVLFYFSYVLFFKKYLNDKNSIMKLNISIYENLMYKEPEVNKNIKKEISNKEKNNDKNQLY